MAAASLSLFVGPIVAEKDEAGIKGNLRFLEEKFKNSLSGVRKAEAGPSVETAQPPYRLYAGAQCTVQMHKFQIYIAPLNVICYNIFTALGITDDRGIDMKKKIPFYWYHAFTILLLLILLLIWMNADANRRDDERRKMLRDSLWTAYTDTTAFLLGNQDGSPLILYTSTNQTEKDALYTKIVTEQWGAERIQREKPETDPLFQVIFLLGVQWETEDAVFYMDRDEVCYVITFWDDCFSVFEPSAVFEPGTELYTIYQYTDEFFLKRMGNVFERWNEGGQEKGVERFEGVVAFYRLEGGILSLP